MTSREKAREYGLRTRALGGGHHEVRLHIEDLAVGAEPIESRGIACRFALRQHVGKAAKAIARRFELALPNLSRHELREGALKIGTQTTDLVVGAARAGRHERRRRLHFELRGGP